MMEAMMGEEEVGAEEAPASAFEEYAAEALGLDPGDPATPDRAAAFKAAILDCLEENKAGGYDKEGSKPKGDGGLALIFGDKK